MAPQGNAQTSQGDTGHAPPGSAHHDEVATGRKLRAAIKLLAIFCVVYFVAALIATPEFKHLANVQILNLPLGLYTGLLVFAVGIIVTRMCLNQDEKN